MKKRSAIHLLVIVASGLAVYSSSFNYPFFFDDIGHIVNNIEIRDLSNFWPPEGRRYVGYLSLAINYALGGLDTTGYHVFNVAVHIMSALTVWWLASLVLATPVIGEKLKDFEYKDLIALFAALVFVVHPLQTESVTYIVQRFTSMAALFYMLSLALYMKARLIEKRSLCTVFYILSLLSAVVAMKTKEISFTLPFAIALLEFYLFKGSSMLSRARWLFPFALTLFIIPLSILGADKPLGAVIGEVERATRETEELSRTAYLATQMVVIMTYLRLLILPIGQNLDYDYPMYSSFLEPVVLAASLFILLILAFAVWLYLRFKRRGDVLAGLISLGIIWFFLTLSVESSVIPISDVIFEHRLYLPSFGVFFAASAVVVMACQRFGVKRLATCVVIAAIVTIYSGAAYARNMVWRSELALWTDVVSKSPAKARPHNNLALAHQHKGEFGKALEHFRKSLSLDPEYEVAHNNIAVLYSRFGNNRMAEAHFKEAIRLDPNYDEPHYNLALIYQAVGDYAATIEHFKEYSRLNPENAGAVYNVALIYQALGDNQGAIEYFEKYVTLKPESYDARFGLAWAYQQSGRGDDAVKEYREALRLNPLSDEAHYNIGLVFLKQGLVNEAIKEFEWTLELNPYHDGAGAELEKLSPNAPDHDGSKG